jgi:hypothetical protein
MRVKAALTTGAFVTSMPASQTGTNKNMPIWLSAVFIVVTAAFLTTKYSNISKWGALLNSLASRG